MLAKSEIYSFGVLSFLTINSRLYDIGLGAQRKACKLKASDPIGQQVTMKAYRWLLIHHGT